jgi:hypothetical protein
MEAWLMENIDRPDGQGFREVALKENMEIEWFGNYLPFGVQGGNIDVVAVQLRDSKRVATVIELKVAPLNTQQFSDAANQVIDYSLFIKKAFSSFGIEIELNPVVMSGPPRVLQRLPVTRGGLTPKWIAYRIGGLGVVSFSRVL